ncbi:hypothetical protein ACFLTH_06850 [Bacteroidota bacterium]
MVIHSSILITVTAFLFTIHDVQEGNVIRQFLPEFKIHYNKEMKPGKEPEIFASGTDNEEYIARDFILHYKDEIYFTLLKKDYSYAAIYHAVFVEDNWTEPEIEPFSADTNYKYFEPFISNDGMKFFFVSNCPVNGVEKAELDFDIWVMDKIEDGWSKPQNIGPPINTKCLEAFPSVTNDGTLYFVRNDEAMTRSDIYRSRLIKGKYSEPEILPVTINGEGDDNAFNACIAPDESCLIFCSYRQKDNFGFSDYYVSFRDEDDNWSEAINMGEKFNSPGYEVSLHFYRNRNLLIYSRDDLVKFIGFAALSEITN